ncbi:AAA family ATPase [Paracoccus sp. PAR01]|uniref:AAA family ATPase n=1 Tax=Paracoccus sp. PAR01 TaxID=2769282 RepID=UPI001786CF9C|nr:AAA family ATPase [Paracoccus sp. PAR01]MBD9527007.1 AAA family ATPase [Paracoccus sp. PAR01]
MKIRAIELTNIRRFAGRSARIEGIGDGITVLSEPNEFGKSTFFDALHALFFERHRGTRQTVKALQPHAGGAPEAAIEIDLPQGSFRIEKRWLSRPTARVLDGNGRIVAQDDEAEAWIDRLLGDGLAGPSGLLWVRQGLLGLEPEGTNANDKNERERGLGARRDLLSSVAGEIELMTGGRRLDAVLARVAEELGRLATTTLKPRAGAEWARSVDEAATLRDQEADLAGKAMGLSGDLARRTEVLRQLKQLDDPETERLRNDALTQAREAQRAALAHAEKLAEARQKLRLAELTVQATQTGIGQLEQLSDRLGRAEAELSHARDRLAKAETGAEEAAAADRLAADALGAASGQAQAIRARLDAAQRALLGRAARERATQLRKTLERAEELQRKRDQDRAQRELTAVNSASVTRAESAREARDRIAAQLEAQSVSVAIRYDGALRISADGEDMPEGCLRLSSARSFLLPGIGTMRVDPGAGAAEGLAEALTRANAELTARLAECGAATVAEARQRLAETQRLDQAMQASAALLAELAPQGLDTLRQELARAEAGAGRAEEPVEDPAGLEAALAAALAAEAEARAQSGAVHARAVTAGEGRAVARSTAQVAQAAAEAARIDAGDLGQLAGRLHGLRADLALQTGLQTEAVALCQTLEAAAPDLETVQARLARAESVVTQAQQGRERLRGEYATLNGSIGALAEQGIEERLDEVRGKLTAAEARAARYAAEVQALARLRSALEDARRKARDAYFAPVLRELEPLLSVLHPGAAMQIDDQSLLPVALTRNGQQESLDILSGGTREQIAILTRLAFARLYAHAGQSVPVILDDALVHSDDDRIEAMFTALHRVAKDQQIIVLTCRQRAFAALGGTRATAVISAI